MKVNMIPASSSSKMSVEIGGVVDERYRFFPDSHSNLTVCTYDHDVVGTQYTYHGMEALIEEHRRTLTNDKE